MQVRNYTPDQIDAVFSLTPDELLRLYGRIHIIDPRSNTPRFAMVHKDEEDTTIDLPPGTVDIMSIGFSREHGFLRLSATGDLPTTLATRLLSAINWRRLDPDKTGHSSYGFFTPDRSERTHFIMGRHCSEAVRLDVVNNKPIAKLEITGLPNGDLEVTTLSDNRIYVATIRADEFKPSTVFNWKPVNVPGDCKVNDFFTRIIDGKSGTMIATDNGVYLWRANEVTFINAKGRKVTSIAAEYAYPRPIDHKLRMERVEEPRMAFVTKTEKDGVVEIWFAHLTPVSTLTPITLDPRIADYFKGGDVRVIADKSNAFYYGVPNKMAVIGTPHIRA